MSDPSSKLRTLFTVVGTLLLLLSFTSLGGGYFMLLEESWSFLDAFYFCFITSTTIGFGDLVPSRVFPSLVYIMAGLALTSTVIELIRRQYATSWEQMKAMSSRLYQLSGPLADAIKKMAESGASETEMNEAIIKGIQDMSKDLKDNNLNGDDNPWENLLKFNKKRKRITVIVYESSV